jgi:hypothetical protein
MKFKITLSQLPTNPPIRGEVVLPKWVAKDKRYSLTYNLTENCSTTDKFIGLWKETVRHGVYGSSYNFYPTIDENTFIAMKKRMNWIIETIKTMDEIPNVDESLVLNENSLDVEILKLNALHLYFENVSNMPSVAYSSDYGDHGEIYIYLEEINQLVHSMEGWEPPSSLEFFGTIRVNEGKDGGCITLPLTDEDYNNFTIYHDWGDLTLDYFRVGKDLMASFATGDFKLIKTKGLCQQNTVHTCFEMRFQQWGIPGEPYYPIDLLNKWCDENNVRDYYNLDLPMFNSGRVKLGEIDMTGTTKDEVMSELVKCTSLTNVELIDE